VLSNKPKMLLNDRNVGSRCLSVYAGLFLAYFVILSAGCGGRPQALQQPNYNASRIATTIIETYDRDGDGVLSVEELQDCPPILAAMERFDRDGDGKVSKNEIIERINVWSKGRVALMRFRFHLTLNGKPLNGASVELVPEPALQGVISPASAVSRESGLVEPLVSPEDLPAETPYKGVHMGLYRIKVNHASVEIPPRYNVNTELGLEVARDLDHGVSFDLKTP